MHFCLPVRQSRWFLHCSGCSKPLKTTSPPRWMLVRESIENKRAYHKRCHWKCCSHPAGFHPISVAARVDRKCGLGHQYKTRSSLSEATNWMANPRIPSACTVSHEGSLWLRTSGWVETCRPPGHTRLLSVTSRRCLFEFSVDYPDLSSHRTPDRGRTLKEVQHFIIWEIRKKASFRFWNVWWFKVTCSKVASDFLPGIMIVRLSV